MRTIRQRSSLCPALRQPRRDIMFTKHETFSRTGTLIENVSVIGKRLLSNETIQGFQTLKISELEPYVYGVALNRPDKLNALNDRMWREIRSVFDELGKDPKCRSIVLSGNGRIFTAGIDIMGFSKLLPELTAEKDISVKAKFLYEFIVVYQQCISAVEKCPKPVIAAVHNACIGAGVDLISTADIRYCTEDAYFQIKEVDLGLAADVGTLQRFPKVVGNESLARELCYTARKMNSSEASSLGFVNNVAPDVSSMMEKATSTASKIAEKSPSTRVWNIKLDGIASCYKVKTPLRQLWE
ncbi:ECH1 [Lepeophtheirus salmonis]|uniref:ECH1 n=1 Tax=Lepeophtheirus salmonis TaxID=72036 RepID=A0A7R8D1X4_LEPSM|nr:ECH1 [Lepeophtheirus salmonis]CAF2995680.1 ECH1 [Lepeophtheirus salmonis]